MTTSVLRIKIKELIEKLALANESIALGFEEHGCLLYVLQKEAIRDAEALVELQDKLIERLASMRGLPIPQPRPEDFLANMEAKP